MGGSGLLVGVSLELHLNLLPSCMLLSSVPSVPWCMYVLLEDNFWESVTPSTIWIQRIEIKLLDLHGKHFDLLSYLASYKNCLFFFYAVLTGLELNL